MTASDMLGLKIPENPPVCSSNSFRDNKVKGVNMSSEQFVLDNLSAFDHCYSSSTWARERKRTIIVIASFFSSICSSDLFSFAHDMFTLYPHEYDTL